MSLLYSGYALEEWFAARKFGSNYVKFRTPLTNIRITTFVCNETEAQVIDPTNWRSLRQLAARSEKCIFDQRAGTGHLRIGTVVCGLNLSALLDSQSLYSHTARAGAFMRVAHSSEGS